MVEERGHEEILEPRLPIVDPHHHLNNNWGYGLTPFLVDVHSGHNVIATVHVEVRKEDYLQSGPEHLAPVGETRVLAEMLNGEEPATPDIGAGLVGYADLSREPAQCRELFVAHREASPKRFRGVRTHVLVSMDAENAFQIRPQEHWYEVAKSVSFLENVRELGRQGLTLDLVCTHGQLDYVGWLARQAPETTIIVDHLAPPSGCDLKRAPAAELLAEWSEAIESLAGSDNLYLKLGGCLNTVFWDALPELKRLKDAVPSSRVLAGAYQPMVTRAIEALGPSNCMFESNFPVDRSYVSYVTLWNAFKLSAASYSEEEKLDLFCRSAAEAYKLDVVTPLE